MNSFYRLLGISLLAVTANNFVWFALTYWAYLTTQSVITTSVMGGFFLVLMASSSIWFGSIVDHHKKKHALLGSSAATLLLFAAGLGILLITPAQAFTSVSSLALWAFILLLLCGTLSGTIYNIALPTLIGLIVPEPLRARANGMLGTTIGVSFAMTAVASGLGLAFGGLKFVLIAAMAVIVVVIVLLSLLHIPEPAVKAAHDDASDAPKTGKVDIRGTIQAVKAVPGLFALIFFTTFNNFLGGIFFALMDAYGLTLVSVQTWGLLWGFLSLSFILGGLYIARKGLGTKPLAILFRNNIIMWTVCIFFTIQPSIVLLAAGIFIWMFFVPFTEAIEQTIFQKVVPPERLGRVFGFAHSVEQAASPVTAFVIGPVTQLLFVPFMTTGAGAGLIGGWFGTGPGRGIALVFTLAGMVGLSVTLIAMRSKSYALLTRRYEEGSQVQDA